MMTPGKCPLVSVAFLADFPPSLTPALESVGTLRRRRKKRRMNKSALVVSPVRASALEVQSLALGGDDKGDRTSDDMRAAERCCGFLATSAG
jgi:hypothetical protein